MYRLILTVSHQSNNTLVLRACSKWHSKDTYRRGASWFGPLHSLEAWEAFFTSCMHSLKSWHVSLKFSVV